MQHCALLAVYGGKDLSHPCFDVANMSMSLIYQIVVSASLFWVIEGALKSNVQQKGKQQQQNKSTFHIHNITFSHFHTFTEI